MDIDKDTDIFWPLREENDKFLKRQTYIRMARRERTIDLAELGEAHVARWLRAYGFKVERTEPRYPFDQRVTGAEGRTIRVEVKISTFNLAQGDRGGRYQANIHHHDCDVLIFLAYDVENEACWPFFIPMAEVAPRRNISIWSREPDKSNGQWRRYLNAWKVIHRALEGVAVNG